MRTVVFACVHNAGRSQMAAAWFNAFAEARLVSAVSAGTDPAPSVHAGVVAAMREVGIDLSRAIPRRLTPEVASAATLLVTMGCGASCPVVAGVERDDWPLDDPKGRGIDDVRRIRDEVRRRVEGLLDARGWRRSRDSGP